MARIPVAQQEVALRAPGGQRLQSFDSGAADNLARGVSALAGGVAQIAKAKDDFQARVDEATANDLDAAFGQAAREIESPFLQAQGKNAVDAAKATLESWQQTQANFLARATNERQKGMLGGVLNRRLERFQSQYNSHLTQETEKWQTSAEDSRLASVSVDVANAPVGSEERNQAFMALSGVLDGMALRRGWDPETRKTMGFAAVSDINKNTIGALVEAGKPHDAMEYLNTNEDFIDPAIRTTLRSRVREQVDVYDARSFAQSQNYGVAGAPVEASVDALWGALKNQESGNKHTDGAGRLITSPKGAFGIAQLMPDTADYIARQMGDPSLAAKSRTDPAVNERMGRWYLGKQLEKYGSASLALAAYNAGPGRVDRWLVTIGDPRTGNITESEWAARIPFQETRDYVQNIVQRSGGSAAMSSVIPEGQAIRLARAAAGDDPRRQAAFEAAVSGERRRVEADRNDVRAAAREAVQAYLPNGSSPVASWTDIPAREWNALDPEYQNTIRGVFATQAASASKVETDEELYGAIVRMYAQNPGQLAALDPAEWAGDLNKEDYRRVQGWWLEARQDPDGNATPRGRAWKDAYDQIQVFARSAGVETDANKQSDEDRVLMNGLQTYVSQRVDAYVRENNGVPPDSKTVAGWAAFGLRQTRGQRRGLFGLQTENQYGFQMGIGETVVPSAARNTIVSEFRRARRELTEADVREAYEFGLRSGRFAPARGN
jgi:hypothetical protein